MSVPPELMRLMAGAGAQGPQAGQPPTQQPQPGGAAPSAAGIATPQRKAGEEAAAKTNVHIAMNMLEQALPVFGSESKEGKVILKTLTTLGNEFGNDNQQDLVPAQIMQLVKGEPSLNGGALKQQLQSGAGAQGQPPAGQPQAGAPRPPGMGA